MSKPIEKRKPEKAFELLGKMYPKKAEAEKKGRS